MGRTQRSASRLDTETASSIRPTNNAIAETEASPALVLVAGGITQVVSFEKGNTNRNQKMYCDYETCGPPSPSAFVLAEENILGSDVLRRLFPVLVPTYPL